MEVTRTKNGDRAILVYLLDAQGVDESTLETATKVVLEAIEAVLAANGVEEVEKGATVHDELETAKTVEAILAAENWRRSVRVGAVKGTILASLYFAKQPLLSGKEEEEEEPEPISLPGVVCVDLAERFPGLRVEASSFVIKPDQRAFDFTLEKIATV